MEGLLVAVLVVSAAVAFYAFRQGDQRRRAASGVAGPRPATSVGEALRRAERTNGRALVVFLSDDEASIEAGQALAGDPGVVALLGREDVAYVVVRSGGEEADVARVVFAKYTEGAKLPAGPVVLALDGAGGPVGQADGPRGPLGSWLPGWFAALPPAPGRRPAR